MHMVIPHLYLTYSKQTGCPFKGQSWVRWGEVLKSKYSLHSMGCNIYVVYIECYFWRYESEYPDRGVSSGEVLTSKWLVI